MLCEKFGVNKSKITVHIKRMLHGPQFGLQILLHLYETSRYYKRIFFTCIDKSNTMVLNLVPIDSNPNKCNDNLILYYH